MDEFGYFHPESEDEYITHNDGEVPPYKPDTRKPDRAKRTSYPGKPKLTPEKPSAVRWAFDGEDVLCFRGLTEKFRIPLEEMTRPKSIAKWLHYLSGPEYRYLTKTDLSNLIMLCLREAEERKITT